MIIAATLALAAQATAGDGNWWCTVNRQTKTFYVCGMIDGIIASGKADQTPRFYYNSEDRLDQLVDGLDRFYADFRNRGIAIPFAAEPVIMAIEGAPLDKINQKIADFRRITAAVSSGH